MTRLRSITKNRAITLPKDISAEFGITGGEAVELTVHRGVLTIRKRVPKCRFCGDVENAKTFEGIDACPRCAVELKEAVCCEC
jgi:AbrB family looped-hinge helix DNA binding protein